MTKVAKDLKHGGYEKGKIRVTSKGEWVFHKKKGPDVVPCQIAVGELVVPVSETKKTLRLIDEHNKVAPKSKRIIIKGMVLDGEQKSNGDIDDTLYMKKGGRARRRVKRVGKSLTRELVGLVKSLLRRKRRKGGRRNIADEIAKKGLKIGTTDIVTQVVQPKQIIPKTIEEQLYPLMEHKAAVAAPPVVNVTVNEKIKDLMEPSSRESMKKELIAELQKTNDPVFKKVLEKLTRLEKTIDPNKTLTKEEFIKSLELNDEQRLLVAKLLKLIEDEKYYQKESVRSNSVDRLSQEQKEKKQRKTQERLKQQMIRLEELKQKKEQEKMKEEDRIASKQRTIEELKQKAHERLKQKEQEEMEEEDRRAFKLREHEKIEEAKRLEEAKRKSTERSEKTKHIVAFKQSDIIEKAQRFDLENVSLRSVRQKLPEAVQEVLMSMRGMPDDINEIFDGKYRKSTIINLRKLIPLIATKQLYVEPKQGFLSVYRIKDGEKKHVANIPD